MSWKLGSGWISYSRLPYGFKYDWQNWGKGVKYLSEIPDFFSLLLRLSGVYGCTRGDREREEIGLRLDQCVIVLNPASQWGHCFHLSHFRVKTLTLWKTLHIFVSDMEISSQPFSDGAPLISFEVLLTPSGVSRRGNQILLPRFLTLCH